MTEKIWTIKEIIFWTKNYFENNKIDSPRLTAELLLSKAINKDRISLYTNFDKPLNKEELKKYKSLIKRRIKGEPTAYILGEKEFWSLNFKVSKDTLIPRPETEILIEKTIEYAKTLEKRIKILEIGTGCGNIAIALAKELENVFIISIDINFKALEIANINIKNHNVKDKVFLVNSNIFNSLKNKNFFDILVSNPPYIDSREINNLQVEIKDFEPLLALDGGVNGLVFYEKMLLTAKFFLNNRGKIFFEFGTDIQAEKISTIAKMNNYREIKIFNDYSNLPRVFSCSK